MPLCVSGAASGALLFLWRKRATSQAAAQAGSRNGSPELYPHPPWKPLVRCTQVSLGWRHGLAPPRCRVGIPFPQDSGACSCRCLHVLALGPWTSGPLKVPLLCWWVSRERGGLFSWGCNEFGQSGCAHLGPERQVRALLLSLVTARQVCSRALVCPSMLQSDEDSDRPAIGSAVLCALVRLASACVNLNAHHANMIEPALVRTIWVSLQCTGRQCLYPCTSRRLMPTGRGLRCCGAQDLHQCTWRRLVPVQWPEESTRGFCTPCRTRAACPQSGARPGNPVHGACANSQPGRNTALHPSVCCLPPSWGWSIAGTLPLLVRCQAMSALRMRLGHEDCRKERPGSCRLIKDALPHALWRATPSGLHCFHARQCNVCPCRS